jgi:hypothetical protein
MRDLSDVPRGQKKMDSRQSNPSGDRVRIQAPGIHHRAASLAVQREQPYPQSQSLAKCIPQENLAVISMAEGGVGIIE